MTDEITIEFYPKNVVEALARVMAELPAIAKVPHPSKDGKGVTYAYRGIEEITAEAQSLCAKYGVVPVPRVKHRLVEQITVNGNPWTDTYLEVDWDIYGPGGVDDKITATTFGHGRDNSDKGTNKAQTQAFKYLLLPIWLISDPADDNDGTNMAADGAPTEMVNGQAIPLDVPMETHRTGPEGVQFVSEAQGKRIYAMSKGVDQNCNVNELVGFIIGRTIGHTSQLTLPEFHKVEAELKRRGA
jgi:hypothetical protein